MKFNNLDTRRNAFLEEKEQLDRQIAERQAVLDSIEEEIKKQREAKSQAENKEEQSINVYNATNEQIQIVQNNLDRYRKQFWQYNAKILSQSLKLKKLVNFRFGEEQKYNQLYESNKSIKQHNEDRQKHIDELQKQINQLNRKYKRKQAELEKIDKQKQEKEQEIIEREQKLKNWEERLNKRDNDITLKEKRYERRRNKA